MANTEIFHMNDEQLREHQSVNQEIKDSIPQIVTGISRLGEGIKTMQAVDGEWVAAFTSGIFGTIGDSTTKEGRYAEVVGEVMIKGILRKVYGIRAETEADITVPELATPPCGHETVN